MTLPLRRVLMHAPGRANEHADPAVWNYSGPVDRGVASAQHRAFVELLTASDVEVTLLADDHGNAALDQLADAVYTHDPSLVAPGGAILLRMGKELRRGEPAVHEQAYARMGVPILGRIEAPGTVEGGDCLWIDEQTLFVGRGFRTNASGIEQLAAILKPQSAEVVQFDLPFAGGQKDCMHLMSIVSLLDADLALALLSSMPVRLFEELSRRGIHLVEAPADEYHSSRGISANVLAVGPRDCVMVEGFPKTVAALQAAGCRVRTFPGTEICTKMEGGPTCLTRPVLRSPAP
jgi:N-dimethylarginine dimethylaminohydrolase